MTYYKMKKNPQMSPENTCNALVCIVSFIYNQDKYNSNKFDKKNDINIKTLNKNPQMSSENTLQ